MNYSRRNFTQLFSGAAISALSGCAAPLGSQRSYLSELFPEDRPVSPEYFWADVMLQAVRDQQLSPPLASRVFAMGFGAADHAARTVPRGACPLQAYQTAAQVAASEALRSPLLFDRWQSRGQQVIKSNASAEGCLQGERHGKAVGKAMSRWRTADGSQSEKLSYYLDPAYQSKKRVDSWQLTGPFYQAEFGPRFETFQRGHAPNYGAIAPMLLPSREYAAAPAFLDVRSSAFAEQFVQVKELGAHNSQFRSEDQHEIAFFWEDGPRGGTVPGSWIHLALRLMAEQPNFAGGSIRENTISQLLRRSHLLSKMSLAMFDTTISAWHSKYLYDVLRPETAIRYQAKYFSNPDPRVNCDLSWRSLIPTPNFPSYVAGHSTFSGAAAETLRLFHGSDRLNFSATALDLVNWAKQLKGRRRQYRSFSQVEDENGMSRIYGGVHWLCDHTEGIEMGRRVARYCYNNSLSKQLS